MDEQKRKKAVLLFAWAVSFTALCGGLSGSVFSNYFRDAFQIGALQRGMLETPRESGGLLCALIFMALGFLGDAALGALAQVLMIIGLVVMAFLQPTYGVMVAFLFVFSTGEHLFMPINDSIGMSLARQGEGGVSLGYFKRWSNLAAMVAGVLVFAGFKVGFFSFNTPVILCFVLAILFAVLSLLMFLQLKRELPYKAAKNSRLAVRREYLPYYLVTFAYGCQKRIRIVFGPWILIELLGRGADTTALLLLAGRLVGSWVAPGFGRVMDKRGLKFTLRLEAVLMALLFTAEGFLAAGLASGKLTGAIWFWVACAGYIGNSLTDQFQMVHSLLMKKLAGERTGEVTANLSMGLSVDHVMAISVSPLLGWVWATVGPGWVFYISAASVVMQLVVSTYMLPKDIAD